MSLHLTSMPASLFALMGLALMLMACEPTPQEARQHILDEGYSYDARGFIKALNADDMPIKLRFLIADPDKTIRNTAYIWLAACEERKPEDYLPCLEHIQWLLSREADLHYNDKLDENALSYAALNGQLEILTWLIKQGVEVKRQQLVTAVVANMNREMYVPKRERLEEVARALTIQWMAQNGEIIETNRSRGLLGNNPFVKQ